MQSLHSADPHALLEHQDFVRGLAHGLLFDDHEVDDVVQQTWLTAMRGGPRDAAAAKGWLAKVVRSRAHNLRRARVRQRRRETEVARRGAVAVPSAADVAERESIRARVVAAVMELDEPYRATVLLRYFESLAPSQIARQQGIPAATVRTRLKRGLDRLRARLDDAHDGDRAAWCLTLLPLARGHRPGAALALLGKTLLWACLLGVLAVLGALVFDGRKDPGVPEPRTARAAAPAADSPRVDAPAPAEVREQQPLPDLTDPDRDARVRAAQVGFKGRLVQPSGAPAAGRAVEILAFEATRALVAEMDPWLAQGAGLRFQTGRGRTDAQGRFEVGGLWPGSYFVLRSDSQDRQRAVQVLMHSPAPGETVDLGDVTLDAVATLRGRVVDGDGAPVPGALVWSTDVPALAVHALMASEVDPLGALIVHDKSGAQVVPLTEWTRELAGALELPATRTDAAGGFALQGVQPGANVLVVRSGRHAVEVRNRVRLQPGEARDLGDVRLRAGRRAGGVVVDATGDPVPGAQVMVAPRGVFTRIELLGNLPKVDFARRTRTCDAQGRFAEPGLPRAGLTIAFRRGPGHAWSFHEAPHVQEDLRLQLPATASLRVRLRGVPAGVEPRLKLVPGRPRGELLAQAVIPSIPLGGRLEHLGGHVYAVRDLVPGPYTLLVATLGRALSVHSLDTAAEGLQEIALAAGHEQVVVVRDSAGKALPAARVYLRPRDQEAWQDSLLPSYTDLPHWSVMPVARGHTDGSGRAALAGVPAGRYVCTVHHPAFGSLAADVDVPGAPLWLNLEAPGGVRGHLMDRDKPADPTRWMVTVIRASGVDGAAPLEEHLATPGPDGSFAIRGLAPGRYRVLAFPPARAIRTLGGLVTYLQASGVATSPQAEVLVEAGETAEVRLNVQPDYVDAEAEGAAIRGTAWMDGAPLAGARIVRVTERPGFITMWEKAPPVAVGADAAFDLGRLRPGRYRLRLEDAGGRLLAVRTADVENGQPIDVRFDLRSTDLHVEVRDPQGRPLSGVVVRLSGADGASLGGATDAAGHWNLPRTPAGTYRLEAEHETAGFVAKQEVTLTAGARSRLDVRLETWRRLGGSLDLAAFGVTAEKAVVIATTSRREYRVPVKDGRFVFEKLPALPLRIQVMGTIPGKVNNYRLDAARVLQAGVERTTPNAEGAPVLELAAAGLEGVTLERFGRR